MNYRAPILIWLTLVALLGCTVAAVFLFSGPLQILIHLILAIGMAALMMAFFMDLRSNDSMVRLFALGGLAWLVLLVGITLAEVLTRERAPGETYLSALESHSAPSLSVGWPPAQAKSYSPPFSRALW